MNAVFKVQSHSKKTTKSKPANAAQIVSAYRRDREPFILYMGASDLDVAPAWAHKWGGPGPLSPLEFMLTELQPRFHIMSLAIARSRCQGPLPRIYLAHAAQTKAMATPIRAASLIVIWLDTVNRGVAAAMDLIRTHGQQERTLVVVRGDQNQARTDLSSNLLKDFPLVCSYRDFLEGPGLQLDKLQHLLDEVRYLKAQTPQRRQCLEEAERLRKTGQFFTEHMRFNEAFAAFEESLTRYLKMRRKKCIAQVMADLGDMCCRAGHCQKACVYLSHARLFASQLNDRDLLRRIHEVENRYIVRKSSPDHGESTSFRNAANHQQCSNPAKPKRSI